jgi:hypothetical protein
MVLVSTSVVGEVCRGIGKVKDKKNKGDESLPREMGGEEKTVAQL